MNEVETERQRYLEKDGLPLAGGIKKRPFEDMAPELEERNSTGRNKVGMYIRC